MLNPRFLLKLLGFDVSKPLELIAKMLNLVGRSPLQLELMRLLSRSSLEERARVARDLSAAGAALAQEDRRTAADRLADILFSIKP